LECFRWIAAITVRRATRRRQHAFAFVMAQGVRAHARQSRQLAGAKRALVVVIAAHMDSIKGGMSSGVKSFFSEQKKKVFNCLLLTAYSSYGAARGACRAFWPACSACR